MYSAAQAVIALHSLMPKRTWDVLGPYCAECTSPIDGGPEPWPCITVKAVLDSIHGQVRT